MDLIQNWDWYSVLKQLRSITRPAGCIITHLFWFTFYSLSKLQNHLTSVLNISIHHHHHRHLTISLSGYKARNISIAITKKKSFLKPYTNLHNSKKLASVSIIIILILSEFLQPTRDERVQVSSELALYVVFLLLLNGLWYLFQQH